MGYHNNDPTWQANRLAELRDASDKKVQQTAEILIGSAKHYPCNGALPDELEYNLHDAAAVARAALTWKSEYEAWRKRAEEAESCLNDLRDRIRQYSPTL